MSFYLSITVAFGVWLLLTCNQSVRVVTTGNRNTLFSLGEWWNLGRVRLLHGGF